MAALYRAADVMVVTPFADGMNLVAKEYVTCRLGNDGALVLSEFAGAVGRAQAGLPGQSRTTSTASGTRCSRRCTRRPGRSRRRMRSMRKQVREHDIDTWATGFLNDLGAPTP